MFSSVALIFFYVNNVPEKYLFAYLFASKYQNMKINFFLFLSGFVLLMLDLSSEAATRGVL